MVNLEKSSFEMNMKIDAITNHIFLLSEDLKIVKEQTMVNSGTKYFSNITS